MSKDNVKKLFGRIEKDAELQKKYAALMQAHQKETENALSGKLVDLGKTSGFIFSSDDLIAVRAELVDKMNSNRELSDNDLADVAGGGAQKTKAIVFSIVLVGIGCAMVSITEVARDRDCSAALTTSDPNCKNK